MGDADRRIRTLEKEIMREHRNDPTGQVLEKLRKELDELLAGQVEKQAGLWEKLRRLVRRKE